ncbi:MAG: riboflavin biosynthesis protein [bacterium]|nr:MAG: riboflavin biosynthesis protein [bacterium]
MKVGSSVEDLKGEFGCSIATIGNFDGVHSGHREILSRVKHKSDQLGCPSLLVTFDPHPSTVLYPSRSFALLTTLEKKLELIESCGIDAVLATRFTLAFSRKEPMSFVEDLLLPLRVRELYVGHDFAFGAGRRGNVNELAREGKAHGFGVYEIDEVIGEGVRISSSLIRSLIAEGDVEKAARFMNRPHSVSGVVVKGDGRGKGMGFPTCNIGEPRETVPGPGIYATMTRYRDMLHGSATHVGVIPTFDVDVPGIETHIFDFNKEARGEEMEILFYKKLRDTVKFDSIEELKKQIHEDCMEAKRVLRNVP